MKTIDKFDKIQDLIKKVKKMKKRNASSDQALRIIW